MLSFLNVKILSKKKRTLEVSIDKPQKIKIKIEPMETSLDSKSDNEDIKEDLDTSKGH